MNKSRTGERKGEVMPRLTTILETSPYLVTQELVPSTEKGQEHVFGS